jgi:hypothetical protein
MRRSQAFNGWGVAVVAPLLSQHSGLSCAGADSRPVHEIEEVQIIASRYALADLRAELVKTEDAFYDQLNKLIEDPEMHVICTEEPPIGSRIHRRTCGPQYVATANANYTRELVQGLSLAASSLGGSYVNPTAPGVAIGGNEVVFFRKVSVLMSADQTLRDLAQRREKLEILVKAAERAKFKRNRKVSRD